MIFTPFFTFKKLFKKSYLCHPNSIPMAKSKFSKETYLKWYEDMLLMRRFEERAGQLYGMQKIKGFCHLYIGQEAVVAGAISVLRPTDNMITAYRDHAHALGKGTSARAVMAELYGKATGCSKIGRAHV